MAAKKKPELTPAQIDEEIVAGRRVREWETLFEPVENGFYGDLTCANHRIGVLLIRHHNMVAYVGSGVAKGQGMLARLRQLAFNNSTGGHHHAAQQIRLNMQDVDLHLLLFDRNKLSSKDIIKLSNLIRDKYKPIWSAPKSVVKARILANYGQTS